MRSVFECYLEREQLLEELPIAERERDKRGRTKSKKRIKELNKIIEVFEMEKG